MACRALSFRPVLIGSYMRINTVHIPMGSHLRTMTRMFAVRRCEPVRTTRARSLVRERPLGVGAEVGDLYGSTIRDLLPDKDFGCPWGTAPWSCNRREHGSSEIDVSRTVDAADRPRTLEVISRVQIRDGGVHAFSAVDRWTAFQRARSDADV